MNTIDDRLRIAVEELGRALDEVPEGEFRPGVTRFANLAVALVAAAVVVGLVAIPAWLMRDDTDRDVVDTPTTTSAAPTAPQATLVAELGELALINPVVLSDGTVVARAWHTIDVQPFSQPGFARSTDDGATWTFTPSDEVVITAAPVLAAVGDVVVGMGSGGLLVSEDGGETWSSVELLIPDDFFQQGFRGAVTVDEADRFVLYFGNGKWVSSDGLNWEASIQDNAYRSLKWDPQILNDILVVAGEDDRIYNMVPGQALEVSLEAKAEGVSLAAGNGTVVAWGTSLSDPDGTWLGTTTDGLTWSEHSSDLSLDSVVVLSEGLGGGYLAVSPDPIFDRASVYRSPDLETWVEIAKIDVETENFQLTEVESGVLVIAWGLDQQTLWFVDLRE